MKILHVISSIYKDGGGTSEVVPRLCRALQGLGHQVTLAVVAFGEVSDTANDAMAAGVRIIQFPSMSEFKGLRLSPEMRHGLKDLISQSDIVHLHCLWQAPCWYAAAECLRQNKPYVMMTHGFLEPERLRISKWRKRVIGALFDHRYLKRAKALVATAESEAYGIRAYGLTNPIHIMPIGLDLERFHVSRKEDGERREKKRLLFFSRVTPIKGLDMLIEAWARMKEYYSEWQLVITGPDDRGYTKELQEYIAKLGLTYSDAEKKEREKGRIPTLGPELPTSTIFFTGPVYGDAKYQALQSADAFVLPTRSENWSIAVAEAMATGLPVVCTKGAPWSCLEECHGGYWVDISSIAIEQGLRSVLSLSDSERFAMGQNGRNWVERHLNWPTIAQDMFSFYRKISQ